MNKTIEGILKFRKCLKYLVKIKMHLFNISIKQEILNQNLR